MLSSLASGLLAADDQPSQAGPLGLFIILALGVATVLLIRSMSRHLKRIPPSFDPPAQPPPATRPSDQPSDPPDDESRPH